MSFQEFIVIRVPQRVPPHIGDLRRLERELSSVVDTVNPIAGHEIFRVQGSGKQLYVVVQDPSGSVEGFTYSFELGGCSCTSIGSSESKMLNWTEACEHVASRLRLLLDTISTRLTRQAADVRRAAASIQVTPFFSPSQAPPPSQG